MHKELLQKTKAKDLIRLFECVEDDEGYTRQIIDRINSDVLDLRLLLRNLPYCYKHIKKYLEIGTRKGHSLLAVTSAYPRVEATIIEKWLAPNCNIQVINRTLKKAGYRFPITLYEGNSRLVLSGLTETYDLILVDGDYNPPSMLADVEKSLPLLNPKGVMVVDASYTKIEKDIHISKDYEVFKKDGLLLILSK